MDSSQQTRFGLVVAAALWLWMILAALPAEAAPLDSVPSMDVVRSRLELTPEQEAQLAPLFQQRLAEVQEARAKLEQSTSRPDKRALMRDAKQRQQDFNSRVESLLTPSQKNEWRQIRDETREKLKKRYEEKRE